MSDLLYLYGIVPRDSPAARALGESSIPGIDGAAVWGLAEGALAGAVSRVPAAEFEAEPLNRSIRDLAWLGPRAIAHQAVNARLFDASDSVLPLSFGTIYRDEAAIRQLLATRRSELLERLAEVRGRAEWVLSLERDAERATAALERDSAALHRLAEEIRTSGAGRAFLLQRQTMELRRREALRTDGEVLQESLRRLAECADKTYREPVTPPADASSRPAVVVARASLLVRREATDDLVGTVEALNLAWSPRGYDIALTGPWPPYRFGGLQLAEGGGR